MPRKSALPQGYKEQAYDLGNDVTVRITYPADQKPAMLHNDRYAVVSTLPDVEQLDIFTQRVAPDAHAFTGPREIASANRTMTPDELRAAAERLGEKITRPVPINSEQLFAQEGAPIAALAAITRAAESDG